MKLHVPIFATLVFAALSLLPAAGFAAETDAETLARKNNCLACHTLDKKLVGPAYRDVAKKYAGDAAAEAMLIEKVRKGGKGVWGPIPMPPNVTVKEADVRTIVQWILAQK